jgi:hypothetical protein
MKPTKTKQKKDTKESCDGNLGGIRRKQTDKQERDSR